MDWLRLKFASKGEEGSGFSPFRGWRSWQQAKEYGKLVEKAYEKVKGSCVRMPYRRDELEFIFERQRDFLWAKTFFPFAFAVGYGLMKQVIISLTSSVFINNTCMKRIRFVNQSRSLDCWQAKSNATGSLSVAQTHSGFHRHCRSLSIRNATTPPRLG